MLVECECCGSYEIGPKVYDELLALQESHWQIERLRDGLERLEPPVKIARARTNIIEVEPRDKKLTKLEKWALRREAERGGPIVYGKIFRREEDDN